jgi:hypothetical protein
VLVSKLKRSSYHERDDKGHCRPRRTACRPGSARPVRQRLHHRGQPRQLDDGRQGGAPPVSPAVLLPAGSPGQLDPQIAFNALDTVTLLRTALDDGQYRWLKESAAVEHLGGLAAILSKTLACTFIPGAAPETRDGHEQARRHDAWCARYRAALRQLEQAGICVRPDQDAGAQQYARLRQEWDPYVARLARYMDYDMAVIDPATATACGGAIPQGPQ